MRLPYSNINSSDNNVVLNLINSTMISALFAGLLDTQAHSFLFNIHYMILHAIMSEFVYYFIHRGVLHHPYCYGWFHKDEHVKPLVCPGDTLFMNPYDFSAHMVSMHVPLLLLRANYNEYFLVLLFFLTAKHFEFTNVFYDHHLTHMSNPKKSFCIVIPLFDFFYDTQWCNVPVISDESNNDSENGSENESDKETAVEPDDSVDSKDVSLNEYNCIQNMIEKTVLDAFGQNIHDDDHRDHEYENITEDSIKTKND